MCVALPAARQNPQKKHAPGFLEHVSSVYHPTLMKHQQEISKIIENKCKNSKVHAAKIQGRVFSEGSEAPQAAQHTHTLLGDPKTGKKIADATTNQQK